MLYVNHFEIAASIIAIVLYILFATRHTKVIKSDHYFLLLLASVLITSLFDVFSSYTISYPEMIPLWLNYFISGFYTVACPSTMYLFMLYTDSLTKIPKLNPAIKRLTFILISYEFITFATTYWTHFKIYFDEELNYCHGPLFFTNYLFPFICALLSIYMVVHGRVKYSIYQKVFLIAFLLSAIVSVIVQLFIPNYLLAGFASSIMLIFLFIAFENPSYYFYKGTRCQNRDSFYRIMKEKRRDSSKNFSLVLGKVDGYDKMSQLFTGTERDNFIRAIADTISSKFSSSAYIMGADVFVIAVNTPSDNLENEKRVANTIEQLFASGVNISSRVVTPAVFTSIIPADYQFKNDDEIDAVFQFLWNDSVNNSNTDIRTKIDTAIKNRQRHKLVTSLIENAIQNNNFQVYYQPIRNQKNSKFQTCEALVRLIDDEYGFIPPDEFIPIAEESGLIIAVGDIVLRKVCEFINNNDLKSLGVHYIEVNLSPVQCAQPNMADHLFEILEEYNIDPKFINFEITETAEADISETSTTVANIMELFKRGAYFSVDDFGSGFSAMDHLFSLPINLVKVDRNILWKAMEEEHAMIVLKNTFRMVKELNLKILVEGVETQEMVDVLDSFGCDYIQGYFFSKPIPEIEYVEFLKNNN